MIRRIGTSAAAPWAGLAAGPGAWAASTQGNYALVPWVCAHHSSLVPIVAVLLALIALAGAFVSWLSWNGEAVEVIDVETSVVPRPRSFLAAVGVFLGVLFALVILTQGAAGLVLNGCER